LVRDVLIAEGEYVLLSAQNSDIINVMVLNDKFRINDEYLEIQKILRFLKQSSLNGPRRFDLTASELISYLPNSEKTVAGNY
jgi:hypothetical protein